MEKKINLDDLEVATVRGSILTDTLEKEVGGVNLIESVKKDLKIFLKNRSMDSEFLEFLNSHNTKITVEVKEKERTFLRDFFERLSQDDKTDDDIDFLNKLISNTAKQSPNFVLVLLSIFTKLFPGEIEFNYRDAYKFGEKFTEIVKQGLEGEKSGKITDIILKEPLILGYNLTSINFDNLQRQLYGYGFTPSIFIDIHNSLIEDFVERESKDIISLFENTEIQNYSDLRNFPFEDFFRPDDRTLKIMAKIASKKASRTKKQLIKKDRELDRKDGKVREETHRLLRRSLKKLESLVDVKRMDLQPTLKNIQDEITDLEKSLKLHIEKVQDLEISAKSLKNEIDKNRELQNITLNDFKSILPPIPAWPVEKVVREFWHAQPFLTVISNSTEKQIIKLLRVAERQSDNPQTFKKISLNRKKGFYPDFEKVIENYKEVFSEILEPLLLRHKINRVVEIWPPDVDFENPKARMVANKKIHHVGLNLLPRGKFYRFARRGKIIPSVDEDMLNRREELSRILRKKFSSLTSTLVYDIRGSTFMSHRLQDAKKERNILAKFQSDIYRAARKTSSFILKDTGDGGIFWFGGNSRELYNKIYKVTETEKGMLLRQSTALQEEFKLMPHPESADMAIKTALNLVKTGEEFVRENYMKYRDWFGEITEKEVFHDGITYALLPPQFKSLFRLGIGIASGKPGTEITFTPNAFGDPDLIGSLVDEAALLSSGRSPERSVVLIDHGTLINLLLNSDSYRVSDSLNENDSKKTIVQNLLSILKWKKEEHSFLFDDFTATLAGIYYMDTESKKKALTFDIPDDFEINLDNNGNFIYKDGRIKIIYEILTREENEE